MHGQQNIKNAYTPYSDCVLIARILFKRSKCMVETTNDLRELVTRLHVKSEGKDLSSLE
jgi:hypothetical protein